MESVRLSTNEQNSQSINLNNLASELSSQLFDSMNQAKASNLAHIKSVIELTKELSETKNNLGSIQSEIDNGNKLYSKQRNLYNKYQKIQKDIAEYKKSETDLKARLQVEMNKKSETEKQIDEQVSVFVSNVIAAMPTVTNEIYLVRCIKYLLIDEYAGEGYSEYNIKNFTIEKLVKLGENTIIIDAHKKHNRILIMKTGPHYFDHNHSVGNDWDRSCEWDGWSKRCKCTCKCPYWDDSKVDWLKNINLNSGYPVGKAKCSW